jgi:hypothetical protein
MFGNDTYDRGGWREANVTALKELGVAHVGVAPRGKAKWSVTGKMKDKLVSERAQVEVGIGTLKAAKYGSTGPLRDRRRPWGDADNARCWDST